MIDSLYLWQQLQGDLLWSMRTGHPKSTLCHQVIWQSAKSNPSISQHTIWLSC